MSSVLCCVVLCCTDLQTFRFLLSMHTFSLVQFSSISISFHMRAWKRSTLSFNRMIATLAFSLTFTLWRAASCLTVLLVSVRAIERILSCDYYYMVFYFDFICAFFLSFCIRYSICCYIYCCFASFWLLRHSFMDTWLSLLHWEFENNQFFSRSCCVLGFEFCCNIKCKLSKSLDRTEWMYSDLEIDAVFTWCWPKTKAQQNTHTHKGTTKMVGLWFRMA